MKTGLTDATLPLGWRRTLVYLAWVLTMAVFFAEVEIQIEGPAGWAAQLPTWRIEQHWLLDIFWGGRPMTGYHAWVFSFMALAFFAPLAFNGRWVWREAVLALAGLALFWIVEDFLWFVLNPAFGLARFDPQHVPWHKHWFLGAPTDYWVGLLGTAALVTIVNRRWRRRAT
ncbi:MAG: hypothetical protein V4739_08955 [Pseudomonadota bacterium]